MVAQGLLLLPVAAGAVSSLDYGVVLRAVSGALFAGVAILMIRNLVRLWKVPSRHVGVGSLIALVLAARHAIPVPRHRRARSGASWLVGASVLAVPRATHATCPPKKTWTSTIRSPTTEMTSALRNVPPDTRSYS